MKFPLLIASFVGFLAAVHGFVGVATTQKYNNSLTLDKDGKYLVFWDANATHIVFEVHVETHGYVGFGLSPNGNMFPSDVVVGWVKDSTVHFSDRHTTGHSPPVLDASQDWFLLHGAETEHSTILKFVRKLNTCDDEDREIKEGTVRLIYSYHQEDPLTETQLPYHGGTRRGTKSVMLLGGSKAFPTNMTGEEIKVYDFRAQNYIIPANETTYVCIGFQMPELGKKHHMIKFEPIITPGNEGHLHHLVIQRCEGKHPELHMKSGECYWDWPKDFPSCPEVFIGWAVGGQAFYFPENVGYSVGGPDDMSFYVMQSHYDNPTGKVGMIDSSGIRMTLTSNLREHEAGTVVFGHNVTPKQVIPPQEPAFVTRGYCAKSCIEEVMKTDNRTEVKMFAGLQHAHLLASAIKTRHFRQGVELAPLLDDPSYDFNFQEFRHFKQEIPIRAGDSFTVECTYDTTKLSNVSFGGLSTREEMCESFMYVYPRMTLTVCNSEPLFDSYNLNDDTLHKVFQGLNWTDPAVKTDFKNRLDQSTVRHSCHGNRGPQSVHRNWQFKEKETEHPYVLPKSECTQQ